MVVQRCSPVHGPRQPLKGACIPKSGCVHGHACQRLARLYIAIGQEGAEERTSGVRAVGMSGGLASQASHHASIHEWRVPEVTQLDPMDPVPHPRRTPRARKFNYSWKTPAPSATTHGWTHAWMDARAPDAGRPPMHRPASHAPGRHAHAQAGMAGMPPSPLPTFLVEGFAHQHAHLDAYACAAPHLPPPPGQTESLPPLSLSHTHAWQCSCWLVHGLSPERALSRMSLRIFG